MRNVVLCGFMGCGKTTVGRQLAALSAAVSWIWTSISSSKPHGRVGDFPAIRRGRLPPPGTGDLPRPGPADPAW